MIPLRLCALLISCAAHTSAWRPSFVSNTEYRTTTDGQIVGAQDGNLLRGPLTDGTTSWLLAGMLYGDCVYTGCKNESLGACGFGMGRIGMWASASLSQDSWSALSLDVLPAASRPVGIYFRPHVVFNPKTRRYVLWVRWLPVEGSVLTDDPTLYLTAVSETPAGPYTVVNKNVSMFYANSADDNLFVDDDGTAYIVHNCRSCATHIVAERLSEDYTSCLGATSASDRSALIGPGGTEAPALFKVNGTYFLTMAPLCCYCEQGMATLVFSSRSPLGPYIEVGSLGNAPGAQQNWVFTHPDLQGILWAGNRWGSDPLPSPEGPIFDHSLQYWSLLSFDQPGVPRPLAWQDNFTLLVNN